MLGGSARSAIVGAAIGGAAGAAVGAIMDRQARDLQDRLPNATVERVGEGIAVTFDSGILFDVNSAALRAEAQQNLRDLAASLNDYDQTDVLVVGHTDSTGEASYNQSLSERRADAAGNFWSGQASPATGSRRSAVVKASRSPTTTPRSDVRTTAESRSRSSRARSSRARCCGGTAGGAAVRRSSARDYASARGGLGPSGAPQASPGPLGRSPIHSMSLRALVEVAIPGRSW